MKKWVQRCDFLSNEVTKIEDGKRLYLLTNFDGTSQKKDIEVHTFTTESFYRAKDNLKVSDPTNTEALEQALKDQFDMPAWAAHSLGLPLADCNLTLISQIKACNIYCPWCFVDDKSKDGKKGTGEFYSTQDTLDVFKQEMKEKNIHVIRRSGGEPTLAPWQWTELLDGLNQEGLSNQVYFQGETNLTTGSFIKYLQEQGRLENNFYEKVAEHKNFGVLCSFKGTDRQSFLEAIGISNQRYGFLEDERWDTFDTMVKAGIDCYPFVYDPNPETLQSFLEEGIKKYGTDFVSKTWVFPLKLYTPIKERLDKRHINMEKFQGRLDDKFKRSDDLMRKLVPRYTGHEYKEIPRSLITLKAK